MLCQHPCLLRRWLWSWTVGAFVRNDLEPLRRLVPAVPALWLRGIELAQAWLAPDVVRSAWKTRSALTLRLALPPFPWKAFRSYRALQLDLRPSSPCLSMSTVEEDALERLDWGPMAWKPIVISLDVDQDREWFWAIKQGHISGIPMGPPCKTWSISCEKWRIDHCGPRPGLIREARQIYTANALLLHPCGLLHVVSRTPLNA